MTSESKKRKVDKRLHWGRGRGWLKMKGRGIKRVTFFNASQRKLNNDLKSNEIYGEVGEWL